jgi:hypothetical protein
MRAKERKYTRFDCPITSKPLYPDDPDAYPFVLACDREQAIIAVNRRRGFILHRDGTRTETDDLEKLFDASDLPVYGLQWACEALRQMIKNKLL